MEIANSLSDISIAQIQVIHRLDDMYRNEVALTTSLYLLRATSWIISVRLTFLVDCCSFGDDHSAEDHVQWKSYSMRITKDWVDISG